MLLAEKKPAVSIKRYVFTYRTSFPPCITLSRSLKIVITLTFVTVNNPAAPHFSVLSLQLSGSRSPSAPHFVWVEQYLLAGRCNLAQFLDWGSVASVHDYKFQLFISSAAYFWAVYTALFGACGLTLLSLICKCCCIAVLGVPPRRGWRWTVHTASHPQPPVWSGYRWPVLHRPSGIIFLKEAIINRKMLFPLAIWQPKYQLHSKVSSLQSCRYGI